MKVFKFGGASVNSVERIKNIATIINKYSGENLFIIVSAMGKTTNALEKVAENFFAGNHQKALEFFDDLKNEHITIAENLLQVQLVFCKEQLSHFFTEIEWLLHDKPVRNFDYYYDQIVSVGELLSTTIISCYLNEINISNTWFDVRDIIRTDNNFRDAIVDWQITEEKFNKISFKKIGITQGFIGATDENESTTLGREGSDFSAAIFANLLNAESITIWKDVDGVMNADPKQFKDVELISELSFEEVIEMAYYGAQVIHPKTIKPLQNKKIPLLVKSFLNPELAGTKIHDKIIKQLPPIIIIKENQILMHLHSKDFSFVGEKPMSFLYTLFEEIKIKPNLIQTGAISVQICIDNKENKIEELAIRASSIFDVELRKNLTLTTIRNYSAESINKLMRDKTILLEQKTTTTFQALCF